MSESIIAIFCMGFVAGILAGLLILVIGVDKYAERNSDKLLDGDNGSGVPDVLDNRRDRSHKIHQVDYGEEVVFGLQHLRMALSRAEKEYLDYACECVEKVEREDYENDDDN